MVTGESIAVLGMTEPHAGSRPAELLPPRRFAMGDHYIITGQKVCSSPTAPLLLVNRSATKTTAAVGVRRITLCSDGHQPSGFQRGKNLASSDEGKDRRSFSSRPARSLQPQCSAEKGRAFPDEPKLLRKDGPGDPLRERSVRSDRVHGLLHGPKEGSDRPLLAISRPPSSAGRVEDRIVIGRLGWSHRPLHPNCS